jgi:16S rRNA processing protein RimM
VTAGVWDDMVTVGRVARAHGRYGHVIVNPETDFPESRFRRGSVLHAWKDGRLVTLTIEAVRFHQGRPILDLRGLTTITDAEALAGAELRVPVAELTPLPAGQFYHHDLVGCRVATGDGMVVGEVARVESGSHGSRLVVEASGSEVLVPLARDICVRIDPVAREIVIDPPEGLLDLNR